MAGAWFQQEEARARKGKIVIFHQAQERGYAGFGVSLAELGPFCHQWSLSCSSEWWVFWFGAERRHQQA